MGPLRLRQIVIAFALLFSTFAVQLPAQPTPQATASDACLQRTIPLTVLPRDQQPLPELKQAQVLLSGDQAFAVSPTIYTGPLRVLLLIDTSGSMGPHGGGGGWGIGLQTASFAMDAVPSGATVAVGTFAKKLQISGWTDRDIARSTVLHLKDQDPKGSTALFSGASNAAEHFVNAQFGDVIYLVTDGGDNRSPYNIGHLTEDLLRRGLRVFVFLVGPFGEPKTPEEQQAPRDMEDLAIQTGGLLIHIPWSKEWVTNGGAARMAKSIQHAAASPYQLDFQLPYPLTKPAKLKLETSLDPKRYTVAYPRRLEPCTTLPQP